MTLDADRIHLGLFQGSRPPEGHVLRQAGFQLLVLCAQEYQPPAWHFPGVEVVHAPNADDFARLPSRPELTRAVAAAERAVAVLQSGGMVLSTCWQGWNRSGLVSALSLHFWLGADGPMAIQMVQKKRRGALRNPGFLHVLGRLTEKAPSPFSGDGPTQP